MSRMCRNPDKALYKSNMEKESHPLKERLKELEAENSVLKQQQIEITKAKELYLKIFEEFPALIWRSRLDKLCDYFNKTWLDFTGRTMEQEFGNGWAEGVHPDDFDACLQTYVSSFDKREPFLMEYRMKNKFGEYRWIRDFGRPFYDLDNSFLGYIGSCYDITEIKENENKLIELNATKDKFFSIIAHDLKSPFNSVVGFSNQLHEQISKNNYERIDEFAKIIHQSSLRAMDLLTNLFEWAQSQSGRMDLIPEYLEMVSLINEQILLFKEIANTKSIEIVTILPHQVQVSADKAMIKTILRNLISNGIKFTHPNGKITIAAEEKTDQLIVSVGDNGVGISKDRLETLFRIDESSSTPGTQKEKGSGLGLILCEEFVKKNNGKIWAESEVGIGTTFYFSLPLST